jgi:hypothetical protein
MRLLQVGQDCNNILANAETILDAVLQVNEVVKSVSAVPKPIPSIQIFFMSQISLQFAIRSTV